MNFVDVVKAAVSDDDLLVRAWSVEVHRNPAALTGVARPQGLSLKEIAVAASLLEFACGLLGKTPPEWVADIPSSPDEVFLPSRIARMPRTRRWVAERSPTSLKKRNVYADPDYLSVI